MTHRTNPTDPYNRVHIGPDHITLIEHANVDLSDDNPIAMILEELGVEVCTIRYINGETLSYSKRAVTL